MFRGSARTFLVIETGIWVAFASFHIQEAQRTESYLLTAQLDAGVSTEAKTAREASEANNAAMGKVLLALKGAGIDEKDYQTSRLSLQPESAPNRTAGPATIIEAAGRGRRTARAVDRWLLGVRGEELVELPVINRAVVTQALAYVAARRMPRGPLPAIANGIRGRCTHPGTLRASFAE